MSPEGGQAQGWLRDRLGWTGIVSSLEAHRAPHKGFFFHLGGMTLFLMLVQVASGILLVLYYQPDAAQAHASVERIASEIPYGNLVRNVHLWAGDLFVLALLTHVFTTLVRRSFRPPHELTWLSGVASLVLGVGLAFTGAVLPWSESAYTQARVGSELARYVPVVGEWLRRFMRGGDEVTGRTLGHAYGFHVAALPAAITALVAVHLFLLWRKPARIHDESSRDTIPLYPDFLTRQAVALTGAFVVIMTLAIFVDRPLGAVADPHLASPAGARPPWYFLPVHALARAAPKELLGIEGARFLVGAACALGLVFVGLPFLDRRGSKVTAWVAWGLFILAIILAASALD